MPSNIEWTNETWNPTTGCTRISPGCAHCYAMTLAARLKAMGQPRYQKDGGKGSGPGFGVTLHPAALELPLRWQKPRRVFVDSMSDLFHEDIPDEYIDRVFAVMALTPQHTYQCLTKRPARMREYLAESDYRAVQVGLDAELLSGIDSFEDDGHVYTGPRWPFPLPNVWLGVTVENQRWADERIPILLDTPAAVRFVSAEPLLGPVSLRPFMCICGDPHDGGYHLAGCVRAGHYVSDGRVESKPGVDWVIVGGESGPKHRPFDPAWARSIVAQCREAGVACFVKQMGGTRPGNKLEELPEDLQVREFPR